MIETSDLALAQKAFRDGNCEQALPIFLKIMNSESNDKAMAAYCLGIIFETGEGVVADDRKAEEYYLISEKAGYQMATYRIGSILHRRGEFEGSFEKFGMIADMNPSAAYWAYRLRKDLPVLFEQEPTYDYFRSLAIRQGHLLAKRDEAKERAFGAKGISKIPGGMRDWIGLIFEIRRALSSGNKLIYQ